MRRKGRYLPSHRLGVAGGVHSHQDHAAALAGILVKASVPAVVHAFTDGRDTPPHSAGDDIARLVAALPRSVPIATVSGRYYAMDRDRRWDRVAKAYHAVVAAEGPRFASAPPSLRTPMRTTSATNSSCRRWSANMPGMRDGDGVLCFNFRADRVREILSALLDPTFSGFARRRSVRVAAAAGMTQYSEQLDALMGTIFPPQSLANVLGQVVAEAGRSQLRMAETEKYAHVTYFLNGGEEEPYRGEDRIMVPSPKVATYDLKPEMSAPELTDKAVKAIGSGRYDLIVLNYANPDMVGHTGRLGGRRPGSRGGRCWPRPALQNDREAGGALLVTADHGNCETMRDPETGGPHTAHTTNPVPVLLLGGGNVSLAEGGSRMSPPLCSS